MPVNWTKLLMSGLFALALTACAEQLQQDTDTAAGFGERITNSAAEEWLSHGKGYDEQRFSPLSSINTENVSSLGLEWSFDLGTSRGIEVTPIVADGVMYVTATWNLVHALDAKTGELLWSFDPDVDRSRAAYLCCDAVNRGVALWDDLVFTGTIDGRLIALNKETGETVWDINTVDLEKPYTITGAPRVINGLVMIGNGGAEYGVRGYISAYDALTGEMKWRFHTVPGDPENGFEDKAMEAAAKTWNGEWHKFGGGGTVWDSMAYDPELDLLYIGVGNGAPWNQEIRSPGGGDNLYLSSIVALKASTGEYVWHYQTTPGDTWDYTATQHMILADLKIEGQTRKVIMQAPKNGFFYVLDRETGEFLSANNFVPVNWATHIDPDTGRPIEVEAARWPGKDPYPQAPGALGAHNWHPMAFSPDTGLVYIPAQEIPQVYADDPAFQYVNGFWSTGSDFAITPLPNEAAAIKATKAILKGRLLAWDPVTQQARWSVEHGGAWNGGVLATAGGLVFQGTADAHFAAYDAMTGDPKWRFFSQTGIVAAPVTYSIDGEQYVAVASGWGGSYALIFGGIVPTGSEAALGRVLVFKLGSDKALPEIDTEDAFKPEIPASTSSASVIAAGMRAYDNRCGVCHGLQAQSSGLVPNLKYSGALADADLWRDIVLDGALAEAGMPNFGKALDEEAAEAIRAYVIHQANSNLDANFYEQATQQSQ